MRVVVVGAASFQDRDWLWAGLDLIHEKSTISEIVEDGGCGAAVRALEWACKREIRCATIPAQWELHGPAASSIRDVELAKTRPALVLAAPGTPNDQLAVLTAYGLRIVHLEKMPLAKGGAVASAPQPVQIEAAA